MTPNRPPASASSIRTTPVPTSIGAGRNPETRLQTFLRLFLRLCFPILVVITLWAAFGPASARSIAGKEFAEKVRVADADIQLNGVGVRAVAWVKGYAAGLYLTEKTRSTAGVLAAAGPKRVQLVMLMDVPATEFSKAVRGGIRKNSTEAELAALQGPMQDLCARIEALDKLKPGDVIDLDFSPATGLTLARNGQLQGASMPSPELYRGILKIFVGDKPVDARLKAGLLGQS